MSRHNTSQNIEEVCRDILQLCHDKEQGKMAEKHCRNNEKMWRQKISGNHEKTLDLCCDIQILCRDTTKGRIEKEFIATYKFLVTQ